MSITWDREAAAHLARRAGFGATPAELDSWVQAGLDATVDRLINYGSVDNSSLENDLQTLTSAVPPATRRSTTSRAPTAFAAGFSTGWSSRSGPWKKR
jgi:hypothetical protein